LRAPAIISATPPATAAVSFVLNVLVAHPT
jgi:hypothetical protein